MINKLRERLFRRNENGSSELPVTLVMLPFAVFLIFALIDVTFYMQTRAQVQNILRDGTRQVALYGGNSAALPLNTTGKPVSQLIYETLYNGQRCTKSFCTAPPVVSCTPEVATIVGQQVTCTVRYAYSPVAHDGFFGFSTFITSPPYTLSETSISETRY